jgi:hypothetical protein
MTRATVALTHVIAMVRAVDFELVAELVCRRHERQ